MERDRRLMAVVSAAVVVIFAFSYAVGYFVGKQAGIKEERTKCEMEKKQIVKTLARIAPVSRPQPQIEEKVIGQPQAQETKPVSSNSQSSSQEVNSPAVSSAPEKEENPFKEFVKAAKKEEQVPQPKEEEVKEELSKKSESGKLYFLQLGVFKNKANAVKLANELKAKGFDAKTEFFKGYARVVVGYFKSWQEAEAVRKELLNLGYKAIIRWRKS
ncbi:SPOR domain-containing protein [Thermovibrio sp.]